MAERLSAARLAAMSPARRRTLLAGLDDAMAAAWLTRWDFWARPEQRAPAGDWRIWLLLAGRGFGKTRAGAEWVRAIGEQDGAARIALVGATLGEARAVMVEGQSGLLAIAPPDRRPRWEPSLDRLRWPSGAIATLYGAAEPDRLRGPEHSHGWADEIAKWKSGEAAWGNLLLGLRLGRRPQLVATTTPRPLAWLKTLAARGDVRVTRGRSVDNRLHLPADFLAAMTETYGGTRLGRQELDGEMIEDAPGALWRRETLDQCREAAAPACTRVVIGVDPPAGIGGDACGIIVAGRDAEGLCHILADCSLAGAAPEAWAAAVARAAARYGADQVVAEANNGGAMVASVLRAAEALLPVRLVHAARGKAARAEPVALLYERGRVRHVGPLPRLEDELAGLVAGGGYLGPGRSPDRADALVWAVTALLGAAPAPGLRRL
ncbi:DNA-packaging protein [Sphingomonas morindae]|uniref:Terminase family protein n=1 Tax=Sphingomonas morindae TaxID=1541170 RepID=A0ABY4X3K3_9SPHN|nr:terminase family protein [Sphingomonas morindae]USI71464.1 terminase family protein [Sphingomonas morindae]